MNSDHLNLNPHSITIVSAPSSPTDADLSSVANASPELLGIDLTTQGLSKEPPDLSGPTPTISSGLPNTEPPSALQFDVTEIDRIPPQAFAEMPLHVLIGLSPAQMTREQKIAYVNQLQELRKAPQTFQQRVRRDDASLEGSSKVPTKRKKSAKAIAQTPVDISKFL